MDYREMDYRDLTEQEKITRMNERLAEEESAYKLARDTSKKNNGEVNDDTIYCSQRWFAAAADVLYEFRAQTGVGTKVKFPDAAIFRMQRIAEAISTGISLEPLKQALGGSEHNWSPGARRDIAIAVYYRLAVEDGILSDPSPIKTISTAFGVSRQAVHKWIKRADEVCKDVPEPLPESLPRSLQQAGGRYTFNKKPPPKNKV